MFDKHLKNTCAKFGAFIQRVTIFLLSHRTMRDIIVDTESHAHLTSVLDELSIESRTAKLWVENLIKPVFIMMLFVRAD